MRRAILDGHDLVEEPDLMKWARWFEKAERHVAKSEIGDAMVSTVFLGLDHGFGGEPLFFETMIFGGPHDGYSDRYASWDEAVAGHQKALDLVAEKGRQP